MKKGKSKEKEKLYDVEKIIDKKRTEQGQVLYFVKWLGYSSKENTWESISNLSSVKNMIDEFEKNLPSIEENDDWKKGNLKIDVPKYIIGSKGIKNKLYMNIRWKKRQSNVQPVNSIIPYSEIKNLYPYLLLDYFESRILINNQKYAYQGTTNEFIARGITK